MARIERFFGLLRSQSFGIAILACAAVSFAFPAAFTSWGGVKLTKLVTPAIQVIMFGMGTTLTFADFVRVVKCPWTVATGVFLQFLVMPLVGFALALAFGFSDELAAGCVLIGSVAGGTASNVIAYLARANVALSVTMTCCSTLLSPVATPLLMKVLAGRFVEIDARAMMLSILMIVIVFAVFYFLMIRPENKKKKIEAHTAKDWKGRYTVALMPAEAWVKDGLIDILVVGNFGGCVDFNIPFADWTRLVDKSKSPIRVIPSADDIGLVQGGCKRKMEVEDYRGWMEALSAEGATGAYLFNFFSTKPLQAGSTHDEVLRNGLCGANALEGKRRYVATYRDSAPREAPRELREYQVPATLDKPRTFRIKVGRPPASGKVSVILVFRDKPISEETPVTLNGVAAVLCETLPKSRYTGKGDAPRMMVRCEAPLSALKPGVNIVSVGPDRNPKTTVAACELEVEPLKK